MVLDTEDQIKDEITVINNNQYLMVLGRPGTGKSTLLKKIGLEALNFNSVINYSDSKDETVRFTHCSIPVFIELREFNTNATKLEEIIRKEFDICGFPAVQRFTETALEEGKLLILLDGLDEVPAKDRNSVAVSRSLDMDCSLEPARHRARALLDGIACTIDPSTIRNFAQNTGRKSFNVIAEVAAINPELIPLLNPQHEIDFPSDQKLNFDCDKDLYKLVGLALAIAHDLQEKAIFKEVDFHSLISSLKGLRGKLVNHEVLPDARRDFAHELLQTWCNAFNLNPELIKLSEAETKALGDYFYANLLMLRCKVSAVQLSPDVWSAIEQRVLLVPSEN